MTQVVYFTNNLKIEVLMNNTVRLTNNRENGKIYDLDTRRFYQLLKCGGKKWRIPNRLGNYEQLTFNVERRHISSAGGGINTFIDAHDYKLLMKELQLFPVQENILKAQEERQ